MQYFQPNPFRFGQDRIFKSLPKLFPKRAKLRHKANIIFASVSHLARGEGRMMDERSKNSRTNAHVPTQIW
jgi:hypothetical protein